MKPMHGYWLIVALWTFGILSRIALIITQGRAAWLGAFFYLDPIVYTGLGLAALCIAYSGQMAGRYRIVLALTGLAIVFAGAIGAFTGLTLYWWVQWPSLALIVNGLGIVIEAMQVFAAIVLGLAGTDSLLKRFLVLFVPGLWLVLCFAYAPDVRLHVLLIVAVFAFLGSYIALTFAGDTRLT